MDKKEEFKIFANKHPELITYLKNNKDSSWQKLYELYDIYGDNEEIWSPYLKSSNNIIDTLKNIDISKVQEHIKTAQKALSVVETLTSKSATNITKNIPKASIPINKFFGD